MTSKLNPFERAVLEVMMEYGEDHCLPFAPIMQVTGFDRKTVRRACRSLKRKGLAEFHVALWDDHGEPAGAGYCATRKARDG